MWDFPLVLPCQVSLFFAFEAFVSRFYLFHSLFNWFFVKAAKHLRIAVFWSSLFGFISSTARNVTHLLLQTVLVRCKTVVLFCNQPGAQGVFPEGGHLLGHPICLISASECACSHH